MVPDIIKIDFNITNILIENFSLDNEFTLCTLYEDRAVFGIKNFTGNMRADYQYISDPPIFADIGTFKLDIENTTAILDFTVDFFNIIEIIINKMDFEAQPFNVQFDGVSDISDVSSRFINFVGNIIRGRLVSINKYLGPQKLSDLVNDVIEMIPDEIDIPTTDLYLEGGISDDFTIKELDYIEIPMDISIHNRSRVSNRTNNVDFKQH